MPLAHTKCGVALPIFNEGPRVEQYFQTVRQFADQHPDFSFCWVDDGSFDNTGVMLQSLAQQASHPRITVLLQPNNLGKGAAVHRALNELSCELFFFTDGDLAYSLDHLLEMQKHLEKYDIVIGSRSPWRRSQETISLRRCLLGWTFNLISRLMLGLSHRDMQSGLKAFHEPVAKKLFALQQIPGFAFDAELLYLAKKLHLTVYDMPVEEEPTHSYTKSKVKLLKSSYRMLVQLLTIRWNDLRGRYQA